MKCKLHPYHNGAGVCAKCLHDRLLSLIPKDKHPSNHKPDGTSSPPPLSPSPEPLPDLFPRSVSPYVPASSRKRTLHFFHTPQAGPDTSYLTEKGSHGEKKKFSFLYSIFGRFSKDKVRSNSSSPRWMHRLMRRGRRRKCHMDIVQSTRKCPAGSAMSVGHNLSWKLADTGRFQ